MGKVSIMPRGRISVLLTVSFLILAILPLLILVLTAGGFTATGIENLIIAKNGQLLARLAREVESFADGVEEHQIHVADIIERGYLRDEKIQSFLDFHIAKEEFVDRILLVDNEGIVRTSAPMDENIIGNDVTGYEFFGVSGSREGSHWSRSSLSVNGTPTVIVSSKALDGWIVYAINLNTLNDFLGEMVSLVGGLAYIIDSRGTYISHPDREKILRRVNIGEDLPADALYRDWFRLRYHGTLVLGSLRDVGEIGWRVGYLQSEMEAMAPMVRLSWSFGIILVGTILFALLLSLLAVRVLIRPLQAVMEATRDIVVNRFESLPAESGIFEFDVLAKTFNAMAEAILDRENSLKQLNESLEGRVIERTRALEQSLDRLRSTRDQLILSEKMAALGGLVSGVTHEINTPLGIGVTAISFLNDRTQGVVEEWEEKELTQEGLERFLRDAAETTRIVLTNLDQAANILTGLKQVAVDQSLDEVREFDLAEYLREVLAGLSPELKKGKHQAVLESSEPVPMKSTPGAFAQLFTNLIVNSVIHGFDGREGGTVTIRLFVQGDMVVVSYGDDGRGLTEDEKHHIFDPFYTTRRGDGGTGLGMNIVYNLVIQNLLGTIVLDDPPEGGIGFTMTIPRNRE